MRSEHDPTAQPRRWRDLDALAADHSLTPWLPFQLQLQPAGEEIAVCGKIFAQVPDIAPVALPDVAVERQPAVQHLRKEVLAEVVLLPVGDELQHLRLQHVDAGVDRVGEEFAPGGLLQKAHDAPIGVGEDNAVGERMRHPHEQQGRHCPVRAMPLEGSRQVERRQDIGADDQEGLRRQQLSGVAHASGGAVIGFRLDVLDLHIPRRSGAEVVANVLALMVQQAHQTPDAVTANMPHDPLHNGHPHHGHHRLRATQRERTKPGTKSPCHDHGLAQHSPVPRRTTGGKLAPLLQMRA
jgi:hypothetical protein